MHFKFTDTFTSFLRLQVENTSFFVVWHAGLIRKLKMYLFQKDCLVLQALPALTKFWGVHDVKTTDAEWRSYCTEVLGKWMRDRACKNTQVYLTRSRSFCPLLSNNHLKWGSSINANFSPQRKMWKLRKKFQNELVLQFVLSVEVEKESSKSK